MSKTGPVLLKMKSVRVILVAILVFGYFFYLYPVTLFQKFESAYLTYQGVKFQKTPHFDYFEKNNCSPEAACQCVLLIHGLGDFAYTWSQTLASDALRGTHFFAVNLPGSLNSPKLSGVGEETYSLPHLTALLQKEILPLCEKWVVAGNSYGGWISLKLAEKDPRIQKLILLAPAGLKKDYHHVLNYFMNPDADSARAFYHKAYYKTENVPTFIFESIVRRAKTQPVMDMLRAVRDSDYIQASQNLRRPILLIWGDHDQVLPTAWAAEYQGFLLGSSLKMFRNCGHLPQKECFTDFQKELVSFLNLN